MLLAASALKSCVLLAGAFAALPLLRSAALRHAVLAAAIGSAAVMPALALALPHWTPASVLAPTALVMTDWLEPARPWLLPVWAGVATLLGLVVMARLAWLAWLRSRCDEITEGALADLAVALTAEFHLARPVMLLRSDNPSLLGTWGLDPKIIVPAQAEGWTEDRARIVLRHELAHVRRHDWLILIAAETVRAIYWFNPLMWIACRRLRDESEHACDAEAVRGAIDGREYAAHLVDLARTLRAGATWWPAAAMARRSALESRVRAILAPAAPAPPASRRAKTLIAMSALTMMVPLAVIGPPRPRRAIPVPDPRAQRLTLMLDGRIVDLSQGWPPTPDSNAGLVAGTGLALSVRTNR